MKRILLTLIICLSVLTASAGSASAQMPIPENPGSLFGTLITLIQVGRILYDAVSDDPGETEPEFPAAPTEEPVIPTAQPAATAVPTAVPTAAPTPTELPAKAPAKSAPADPESVADSTGIGVNDFYNTFKANIKKGGRHSVSLEERGRKGAAKVIVDDNIEVYLYNTKSVISRFSFEAVLTGSGNDSGTRTIFSDLLNTIGGYLGIRFTETDIADIYETVSGGGSLTFGKLLLYGTVGEKKGKSELAVKIYYTGAAYVEPETTSYSADAENEFRDLIAEFKEDGVIPNSSGKFYFHEDYKAEWAQINWYQWESFDTAQNFVISADIDWKSASDTPNYGSAGCGFVFRSQDTNNNLYGSVNMDGKVHFGGFKSGNILNYPAYNYGPASTRGTAQFILVVNGEQAFAYVDGSKVSSQYGLAVTGPGMLAFNVMSGTNKDFGTRCTFRNIYYYVW